MLCIYLFVYCSASACTGCTPVSTV